MEGDEYFSKNEAIRLTRGYEIFVETRSLGISFGILKENEARLLAKLHEHSDLESCRKFDGYGNKKALDLEFREIIRLLHNYAAAVSTLVDHTRRIARRILDQAQLKLYEEHIAATFKSNPVSLFLKDLRNNLVHRSHPPISRVVRFEPAGITSVGIELGSKELLKWGKWKKPSRDLIVALADGVHLGRMIGLYYYEIEEFHIWLDNFFTKSCKSELDAMWSKHDAWVLFCKKRGIPTTEEEFQEEDRKFREGLQGEDPHGA